MIPSNRVKRENRNKLERVGRRGGKKLARFELGSNASYLRWPSTSHSIHSNDYSSWVEKTETKKEKKWKERLTRISRSDRAGRLASPTVRASPRTCSTFLSFRKISVRYVRLCRLSSQPSIDSSRSCLMWFLRRTVVNLRKKLIILAG